MEFAKAGLKDPVLVRLDVDSKLSEQLKLAYLATRPEDKPGDKIHYKEFTHLASSCLLFSLPVLISTLALLLHLLGHVVAPSNQTVVFTATKHHVEYLRQVGVAIF